MLLPKKQKKPKNPNRRKVRSRHPAKVKLMSVRRKIQKTVPREARKKLRSSTEGSTEGGTEENTEGSTDESTGDGTVSGNDKPEPVCNCEDQCGAYEYDKNCPVCVTDYKPVPIKTECEYQNQTAGGVA